MIKNLLLKPINRQLIQDFEKHIQVIGYQGSNNVGAGVRELLHRMEKEKKEVNQITSEDIKKHYEYLLNRPNYTRSGALSPITITGYLYSIKLFFIYTQKIGLTKSNPMSILSFPRQQNEEREILEKEEVNQLYKACETDQERAILSLFYGCGLRKSEAEKLNLKDIDHRGKWLYVRIGKGKKRRVIPLTESVVEDLKNYRHNERPRQETRFTKASDKKAFMLNKIGTRMRGGSYWKLFKEILKRSKVKKQVSLHHLRHTIATHLLASGMSIEQVRDFLGHDHLESTQIYTRVNTNQLQL